MKPSVRFLIAAICCTPANAVASHQFTPFYKSVRLVDFDALIPALIAVESGGDDNAIGDGGYAYGSLQIWKSVIKDVNRYYGTTYAHRDAFVRERAIDICRKYLALYCTPERLGREPTLEDAARIWNGGPKGWKNPATVAYWKRVKANLIA